MLESFYSHEGCCYE